MRLFCTVGSRLPFDRLTRTVATFAQAHGTVRPFFQIGEHAAYVPEQDYEELLDQRQFDEQVDNCDLIVAHAGMGTILTGLTQGRPVLVLPRRECYQETRNDHQVYTASQLGKMGLVHIAMDEKSLLDELEHAASFTPAPRQGLSASQQLIQSVQTFIDGSTSHRGAVHRKLGHGKVAN